MSRCVNDAVSLLSLFLLSDARIAHTHLPITTDTTWFESNPLSLLPTYTHQQHLVTSV